MDARAFRLANRIVGNPESAAALECTLVGPTLRFHHDAIVAIAGADMQPRLDGRRVPLWSPVHVPEGSTLELGTVEGAGARAYVAISGGVDVPRYLGSASTFTLGKFGGHGGRALRSGDVLHGGVPTGEPASIDGPRDPALLERVGHRRSLRSARCTRLLHR